MPQEQLGVDVAAADDDDARVVAGDRAGPTSEVRAPWPAAPDGSTTRRARRASWRTASAISSSVDGDDLVHEAAEMLERERAERVRAQAIGHRAAGLLGGPGDEAAALERLLGIGRELRLDADDARGRRQRLDRRGDAGRQPTTGDRHHDAGHAGQVLDDLEPARALAGDDGRVVVRLDHDQPALLDEAQREHVALLRVHAGELDLGAVALDALDLDARRVARHADHRVRAEQPRGTRHRLGVVARRVGDDAAGALGIGQRGDLVVRAAHLEGADGLERLRLQPGRVVPAQERRAGGDAADALGRLADLVDRDDVRPDAVLMRRC